MKDEKQRISTLPIDLRYLRATLEKLLSTPIPTSRKMAHSP